MTVPYREMLLSSAEPELAGFNSMLTPGKGGIVGVRVPRIREVARAVVADDWRQVLLDEPGFFEEEMLVGIVLATAPVGEEERILLIDGFLDRVDNWAVCDALCSSWKPPRDEGGRVWDYLASLMSSGDEFRMRVSVVARMSIFRDVEHDRMLLDDIASHDHPGYYYRMGAAWAVSVVYVRHPDLAEALLASGAMEPWTHNKSIQKIRESRRVSAEDKERLRALRRTSP